MPFFRQSVMLCRFLLLLITLCPLFLAFTVRPCGPCPFLGVYRGSGSVIVAALKLRPPFNLRPPLMLPRAPRARLGCHRRPTRWVALRLRPQLPWPPHLSPRLRGIQARDTLLWFVVPNLPWHPHLSPRLCGGQARDALTWFTVPEEALGMQSHLCRLCLLQLL